METGGGTEGSTLTALSSSLLPYQFLEFVQEGGVTIADNVNQVGEHGTRAAGAAPEQPPQDL